MTTIVPPPAAPTPQTPPPAGFKAKLEAPEAVLSRLIVAQKLNAVIVGRPGPERAIVQTPVGQMTVTSVAPLPASGLLSLYVTRLGAPVEARITKIADTGEPPTPYGAGTGKSASQGPAAGALPPSERGPVKSAPVTPVTLTIGTKLTATLLKAHPFAVPDKDTASPFAKATTLAGRGLVPPLGKGTSAPLGQAMQTMPIGTRFGATIRALTPPAPHLSAHIRAQAPATSPEVPAAAAGRAATSRAIALNVAPGRTLSAVVTAHTPQGQPIIQSQGAVMVLDTTAALAQGSKLSLTVSTPPQLPKPVSSIHPQGRGTDGLTTPGRPWEALDDALGALNRIDADVARSFIHAALPRADKHFSSTVLFFLSALRGGDVGLWLGEKAAALLKRTRPGALDKLADAFKDGAREATKRAGADWRAMAIPFFDGRQIEAIRLYMRRPQQEENEENGGAEGGVRFVFDLTLSHLGHLQFDALAHPQKKRLDIIVRSEDPLPETMKAEMAEIFTQSGIAEGLNGALGFQSAPPHFVDATPPTPAPSPSQEGILV